MDLADQLAKYGPGAPQRPISLEAAEDYCRRLATSHYENFSVVSRLFPRRLYQHLCNVYAYCRWADDLADEPVPADSPLALLRWWDGELDAAYRGEARHPVFVALSKTIRQFNLPREPFKHLLSAFRRDQVQTRYRTLDDLLTYCEQSANPVGRIVLWLGREVDDENLRLSDSICTGLQLANFWQDVRRDYDRGRIYLPAETWQLGDWGELDFAARRFNDGFGRMLAPLVQDAQQRIADGLPLLSRVGPDLRLAVSVFAAGGRAILAAIRQSRYDVWSRRPTVSRVGKLRILATALVRQAFNR